MADRHLVIGRVVLPPDGMKAPVIQPLVPGRKADDAITRLIRAARAYRRDRSEATLLALAEAAKGIE